MKEILDRLRALQEMDTQILRLDRELEKAPRAMEGHRRALEEARERHRQTVQEARNLQREVDRKHLDLQSTEAEISKLEVQLNTIRTNREYTALLHEIAGRKSDRAAAEEEILRLAYRAEELEGGARGLKAEAEGAEARFREEEERTRGAVGQLEERIAELRTRRASQVEGIDPEALAKYERILRSRDGLALAAVRDGICQGCFMRITTHEITILLGGRDLVLCRTCSRILYLADGEVPVAREAPDPGEE